MLALCNKHKGMLSKIFCSIIVHICILQQLLLKQRQLKFEVLPHPPYILDLAALDYRIFWQLNEACVDKDVPVMMKLWLQCLPGFDHRWKLSSQMGSED